MLIKRILLQNQPHSCYISHFHTSKLDSFRKIRLGHHPKLPFHTCNTQQEIVCLRYTLTTGNTLVLARDGTRVVQRLPPFPCSSPDRFSRPAPKDLALGILNYCVGFRLFFLSVLRFKFSSFFFFFASELGHHCGIFCCLPWLTCLYMSNCPKTLPTSRFSPSTWQIVLLLLVKPSGHFIV